MKKILVVIVMMLAMLVVTPTAPASADECTKVFGVTVACGTIYHAKDAGYDTPIGVRCTYGDPASTRWVKEKESSKKYCKDADQVYVAKGEEIWCHYDIADVGVWRKKFDKTGWHKIDNLWDDGNGCVKRRD